MRDAGPGCMPIESDPARRDNGVYIINGSASTRMNPITRAFRDPDGPLYHGAAVAYAISAWGLGLAGLFHGSWILNAAATLLLAHGMIIAAYLVHECAHNIIFLENESNARLGRFLSWICGASYGRFEDIRFKHLRHHVDQRRHDELGKRRIHLRHWVHHQPD